MQLQRLYQLQSCKVRTTLRLAQRWYAFNHGNIVFRRVLLNCGREYEIYLRFQMSGRKHVRTLRSYVVNASIGRWFNLSSVLVWPQPRPEHTKSLSTGLCRTQPHVFRTGGQCKYMHQ